ncbi:MAG TPA: hypothetical protein VFE78_00720, partial [Gemmataceae bacterium]|nr:hypothetical protein [Gemmataceae bacterium]
MILGLEIGLLVAGLIALCTGKFKLSKHRVATGAPARFAGFVLVLPLPLAIAARVVLEMEAAGNGTGFNPLESWGAWALVELGIALICALLGFGIALLSSTTSSGDGSPRQRPRNVNDAERPPRAPAPRTEEEVPWVVPVERGPGAITRELAGPHKSPAGPQPVPERRAPARPAPARSSSSSVVWWVVGGLAAGLLLCTVTASGLVAWWLLSRSPNKSPVVAGGQPVVALDNAPLGRQQEWGEKGHRPPQFDMPPGMGGPFPGPNPAGPPPGPAPAVMNDPPPFKPIVIPLPSAPHLNVRPPALAKEHVECMLPSAVSDVAVGGGGRFLILHLPRDRQLAVFDVNAAKVVKYLSFADDVKFAAGMDKLLVALPDKNVLQRWSLTTFERELSVPLGGEGRALTLTLGSASNGPLLVRQRKDGVGAFPSLTFYDVRTLRPLEAKWGNNPGGPLDAAFVRASANGKVFGLLGWGPVTLVWDDGRVTITHLLQGGGRYALPSPDGKAVFTDSAIYTEFLRPAPGGANVKFAMPATHGRYYVAGQSVYLLGDGRPLMTLPAEKPPQPERPVGVPVLDLNDPLALDKRGYFIPDAKLLVHVPLSNDRLILRRLDVEAGLEKSGIDYLFVVSHAPTKARRGATYRYRLAVKSKKGGVKYKLESGPPGMKVSDAGLVTWAVPAGADGEKDVILTVRDRTGQEVFHTFRVAPGDEGEEQAPLAADVPPGPAPPEKEPVPPPEVKPPAPPKPMLPPVRPFPVVRPPHLSADKVVTMLPAPAADVAVGGGGRYLLLHLPKDRKIAVFDVSQAKITGHVPLTSDNVRFAAGRDKLIVALADENVLQRWDLATLRREAAAPLPVRDKLSAVALGSASDGPLLVASCQGVSRSELFFMDVATLAKLPIRRTGAGHVHVQERDGVRASADGRVFGIWRAHTSPQGIQTLVLEGSEARGYYIHNTAGHVLPGPDGKVIYTAGGRYTGQVKPLGDRPQGPLVCLPAEQGDYFLSAQGKDPFDRNKKDVRGTLAVHRAGDERPLATLPEVEVPADLGAGGPEPLSADKRVHYIPSARLIVTLPATNDRLVLHRFDVNKAKDAPPVQAPPPAPERPSAAKDGAARELRNMRISKNSYVHALAFTPDGSELLSAGDDGRARRWRVATGQELGTSFDAHPRVSMLSVSISADGRLLATAAIDKTAKVWDAATNKLLATCPERTGFVHAALSPDGKTLATGTTQVRLWNARSGEPLGSLTSRPCFIESLAFSRDGKLLACTGSQNTV